MLELFEGLGSPVSEAAEKNEDDSSGEAKVETFCTSTEMLSAADARLLSLALDAMVEMVQDDSSSTLKYLGGLPPIHLTSSNSNSYGSTAA